MLSRLSLFAKPLLAQQSIARALHTQTHTTPAPITYITLHHDANLGESRQMYQERSYAELLSVLRPNTMNTLTDYSALDGPHGPYYPGHLLSFITGSDAKPIAASYVSFRHNTGAIGHVIDDKTGKLVPATFAFRAEGDQPWVSRMSYISRGHFVSNLEEEISYLPYAPGIKPCYSSSLLLASGPLACISTGDRESFIASALEVKTKYANSMYCPQPLKIDTPVVIGARLLTAVNAVHEAVGINKKPKVEIKPTLDDSSAHETVDDTFATTRGSHQLIRHEQEDSFLNLLLHDDLDDTTRDLLSNYTTYAADSTSHFYASMAFFRLKSPVDAIQHLNAALEQPEKLEPRVKDLAEQLHERAFKQFSS